jgi:tetratricopeptide (TPR) repeat protein
MKIGYRIVLIILFLSVVLLAEQIGTSLTYKNGIDAYRKGQYELAIQEFETILSNDLESSEIYYNLGNAFYRSGNIAGAVWAYESCLKIYPTHNNANYNIKIANLNVVDKMDLPEPPFYLKWYLSVKKRFIPSTWINISLFTLLLNATLIGIIRMTSLSILGMLQGIIIPVLLGSLFLTLHSAWTEYSYDLGIIYATDVEVRSEPNVYSIRLFEVHEGLKVAVNQRKNEWIEIELLDGKTGWIENKHIRLIQ